MKQDIRVKRWAFEWTYTHILIVVISWLKIILSFYPYISLLYHILHHNHAFSYIAHHNLAGNTILCQYVSLFCIAFYLIKMSKSTQTATLFKNILNIIFFINRASVTISYSLGMNTLFWRHAIGMAYRTLLT